MQQKVLLSTAYTVQTYLWLVGRLTTLFSTKIGYIGDEVLGGDLVQPG